MRNKQGKVILNQKETKNLNTYAKTKPSSSHGVKPPSNYVKTSVPNGKGYVIHYKTPISNTNTK